MDFVPGLPGTLTLLDSNFTLQDNIDSTKQLQFQLSSITAGQTRTLTIPDVSSTIAVLGLAQTFTATQTIDFGTGALTAVLSTTTLRLATTDSAANQIEAYAFSSTAFSIRGRAFGGTRASVAATPDGTAFFQLAAFGHDGTSYSGGSAAQIKLVADGLWSLTNNGVMHQWWGTPTGSVSIAQWMTMRDANLLIGGTTTMTGTGGLHLFGTTLSTTKTTGCFIADGGIGVAGTSTFGDKVTIDTGTGSTVVGNLGQGNQMLMKGADAGGTGYGFETYGSTAGGNIQSFVAGGTRAAATATPSGAAFFAFSAFGYDGTGPNRTGNKGYYQLLTGSLWSLTNAETQHQWAGVPATSTALAEWMRLSSGCLLIGGTTAMTGTGGCHIFGTTDSTSITTGAFICDGGGSFTKYLTLGGGSGNTLRYVAGTANASVAVTFGSVGPTGSTAGNAQGWLRVSINGTDRYIPYW